jgi:hypothetical protein
MRYSNRLFLYAPFAILLIIAAVAMLRWREVAHEWEARLLAANRGHEIAPGVTLHFATEEIGGFPFNLDVVLGNFVIAVQSTRGPISLASERFAIHALTYGRAQQILEAAGTQTLLWTGVEGDAHRFVFVPGTLRASAIERDGRLARFDLDLNGLESRSLTGARAQLHIRAAPERDALDLVIRADDLRVKFRDAVLPHIEIAGRMTSATLLSPLLSGNDEWGHALGTWRTAAGAIRLDRIEIAWDASRLAGNGHFALDDNNHISGALWMQLSGAEHWKPTHLVENAFTSALQKLTNAMPLASAAPLPLSLDVHNGAAIVRAARNSRAAGTIDPVF